MSGREERIVTIQFRIVSRDFSARGPALERALIRAAECATQAFRAPGFGVGPYSANTVGVPEANYVLHEHEGHPLEGADHEHAHDGPHQHPRQGLGAIRIARQLLPTISYEGVQESGERSILSTEA